MITFLVILVDEQHRSNTDAKATACIDYVDVVHDNFPFRLVVRLLSVLFFETIFLVFLHSLESNRIESTIDISQARTDSVARTVSLLHVSIFILQLVTTLSSSVRGKNRSVDDNELVFF
jgi:hypothetical protein